MTEALRDEILLLAVLDALDGPVNVLRRHHRAGITVTLNLQRCHLQSAHAKRVDVNGGREGAGNCVDSHGSVLRRDKVHVLDVLPARFYVVVDRIGRYTTDFN